MIQNNGPRNQLSPISIGRTDSVSSLEFRSSGVLAPSRGPSPLTIGLSDSIPLAVAFHEIIHAYFKGSNESRYIFTKMHVNFYYKKNTLTDMKVIRKVTY